MFLTFTLSDIFVSWWGADVKSVNAYDFFPTLPVQGRDHVHTTPRTAAWALHNTTTALTWDDELGTFPCT